MNRFFAVLPCLLLLVLPACVSREPAPVDPDAAPAAVLPGEPRSAEAEAWYSDRNDGREDVVAGPPVAEQTQSVTRTRGGLTVNREGEVRDTLDRQTTRTTVREAE